MWQRRITYGLCDREVQIEYAGSAHGRFHQGHDQDSASAWCVDAKTGHFISAIQNSFYVVSDRVTTLEVVWLPQDNHTA